MSKNNINRTVIIQSVYESVAIEAEIICRDYTNREPLQSELLSIYNTVLNHYDIKELEQAISAQTTDQLDHLTTSICKTFYSSYATIDNDCTLYNTIDAHFMNIPTHPEDFDVSENFYANTIRKIMYKCNSCGVRLELEYHLAHKRVYNTDMNMVSIDG